MYDYETTVVGEVPHMLTAAPQPQPIRRMPVKTRRVDLDGDFVGWWAKVRTNAPFGLFLKFTQLQSAEDGTAVLSEVFALLPQLVHEWNFVDESGADLPCNEAGMQSLPLELINVLMKAIGSGVEVPKA